MALCASNDARLGYLTDKWTRMCKCMSMSSNVKYFGWLVDGWLIEVMDKMLESFGE